MACTRKISIIVCVLDERFVCAMKSRNRESPCFSVFACSPTQDLGYVSGGGMAFAVQAFSGGAVGDATFA